jgi:hypothetical protein
MSTPKGLGWLILGIDIWNASGALKEFPKAKLNSVTKPMSREH